MIDNFFNSIKFSKIIQLYKIDPLLAMVKLEEYIAEYPLDYNAGCFYVRLLLCFNETERAEEYIIYLENAVNSNSHFLKEIKKYLLFESDNTINRVKLLLAQEKYDELYNYYINNRHKILNDQCFNVLRYCEKKLGILNVSRDDKNYGYRQIIEYREEDFREHINKHLSDFDSEEDEPNKSVFSFDFPIDDVIAQVKKFIPSEKKIFYGMFSDYYIFKYDYCGRYDNRITDYFKVITYHNTPDIITMCPVENYDNYDFIDLNFMNMSNSKVKTLSQIEKFNRRYGSKYFK